jgi:PKD repeat protein
MQEIYQRNTESIMKKACCMLSFCLLLVLPSIAQSLQWAKKFGSTDLDQSLVAVDAAGNAYISGYFRGTVDFDPGPGVYNLTAAGFEDTYVLKLDATGNFVWAFAIGSTGPDRSYAIELDGNGNIYLTGLFHFTVDFDPGVGTSNLTATSGSYDCFLLKLNPSGGFLWAKSLGSANSDYGSSLAVDLTGAVYVTGRIGLASDFDPGVGTLVLGGTNDGFVWKVSSAGNLVWAKVFLGAGDTRGNGVSVDANKNVYVCGGFDNTTDFDPGVGTNNLSTNGSYDAYLVKLDSLGALVWAASFGGSAYDDAYSVTNDAAGNAYLTGYFKLIVDLDPGPGTFNASSAGVEDVYVMKLSSAGSFQWAKTFGGTGFDYGADITTDANGNVYTTGTFASVVDFDPGAGVVSFGSAGDGDIWLQKLNSAGTYMNAWRMGGTGLDNGLAVKVLGSNFIYLGGSFNNTSDFDPGPATLALTSAGLHDGFVLKYGQCAPTTSTISPTACNTYTAPGGQTYTTSGTYTATIPNTASCDSIITINLTINAAPSQPGTISGLSSTCPGTTITYSITAVPGATGYTWTLPGGWTGTSTTNFINATASANGGVVTVTAGNTCGASTAQTLTVTVTQLPAQPGQVTGPTPICTSTTNTYSVAPVPGATSYTWNLPSGWTGSSTTNSVATTASTVTGGASISVTADNACGASTAQSFNVTVNTAPAQPGVITGPTSVCQGTTNTYSVATVPGATTYIWTLPSGWSGASTSATITAVAGSNGGTVSVSAENACDVSAPQSLSVNVSQHPTALFGFTTNLLAGSFTDMSTGAPNTWQWDFGDGNSSTLPNPTHTYLAAATYQVCLIASTNGCADTLCQPVTVIEVGLEDGLGKAWVYPNPSQGVFWVETDRLLQGKVTDVHGRVIVSQAFEAGKTALDLAGWADGVYFLRLSDGAANGQLGLRLLKSGN